MQSRYPKSSIHQGRAGRFGGILHKGGRPSRWEVGAVVDYHPTKHTYLVRTREGVLPDVPRLLPDPGDVSALERDTLVVVHHELGFPVIDSVIHYPGRSVEELTPQHLTDVDVDNPPEDGNSFRPPNATTSLLGGDWGHTGPDGNSISVLRGGVNSMRSAPMAQVRTHSLQNLVEILSENFKHITAMGDLHIQSDGGKTSLTWRAGSDQKTEVGGGQENWTIRLDIGAKGDLFNFAITDPDGHTLSKIHLSADGRVELMAVEGIDISALGVTREDLEDRITALTGDLQTTVEGEKKESVGGSSREQVGGAKQVFVGEDVQEMAGRDRNTHTAGVRRDTVGGGTIPIPNTPALVQEVLNGGVEMVIGNPIKGALPSALQGQNTISYVGGLNFMLQPTSLPAPTGGFNVVSLLPGSVNLGCNGTAVYDPITQTHTVKLTAGTFGVMKYEPFNTMFKTLLSWLERHVHGSAMGPTAPPVEPLASVRALVAPIRSIRVAVGL